MEDESEGASEELNPSGGEGEKRGRRFSSGKKKMKKIVMLLTKDTQLITGGRHFIS